MSNLETLFHKWNVRNGGRFYIFSFEPSSKAGKRWQINERDSIISLPQLLGMPVMRGGIDINCSYIEEDLIEKLTIALK